MQPLSTTTYPLTTSPQSAGCTDTLSFPILPDHDRAVNRRVRYAARMEELPSIAPIRRLPLAVSVGNRLIAPTLIDRAFRWHGTVWLARGIVDRLAAVGLPRADGMATLREIRAWEAWPLAWERLGERYLTAADAARADTARRDLLHAASLAFHAAQLLVYEPVERKRTLARRAVVAYQSVAPLLDPPSAPVTLPYRATQLPGYLTLPPAAASRPAPLVVFLNGGSTVKEELNGWRGPFLAGGMATLTLDNPGTGEAWETAKFAPNQHALTHELRRFVADHPALDGQVALIGVSLGGMLAVHLASDAPDLAAVVTITTPFAPGEYITRMPPLTQWEVVHVTGFPLDCQPYLCTAIGLAPHAPRLRMPLLVVGAGRDRVVPPHEARRLYDAAAPSRTLHWYPRASHCCFSHLVPMLDDTARWLVRAMSNEQ